MKNPGEPNTLLAREEELCCRLPSLTERSWCGAEEIMGFVCDKICATRADEPERLLVFYGEALAAFVAGCAGYAEASRLKRKLLLIKTQMDEETPLLKTDSDFRKLCGFSKPLLMDIKRFSVTQVSHPTMY